MTVEQSLKIQKEAITVWLGVLDYLEKDSSVRNNEDLDLFLETLKKKVNAMLADK